MAWNNLDIHRAFRASLDVSIDVQLRARKTIDQRAGHQLLVDNIIGYAHHLATISVGPNKNQVSMLAPRNIRKGLSYIAGMASSLPLSEFG